MEISFKKVRPFTTVSRQVKKLYFDAFPANERLPYSLLLVNSWRKQSDFYAFYDKEVFAGLAYVIADAKNYFILFLAVDGQNRSKGYGSAILQKLKGEAGERPVILTIEPMDESAENIDQRRKRLAFYERNGFILTNHFYHEGQESYQVMVTDEKASLEDFERLMKAVFLGFLKVSLD
ncbi:GNAT family N-acetyltransferase [Streptococcus loxodontisalivarius]|uniref:GNAT superfamily N-acetyltransferase n=1 Tax=Streptococcus loxodontisalivarius TaxID=1349415 RepID=A0ABS2PRD6_9STRE|nr:GNAT family N-acetyltransferase [Streptococcus loxodontisalivarius]MBM7642441.1 GNAT superfamily N-acetyltransferase [Streptococcus loxodontisalivarius]